MKPEAAQPKPTDYFWPVFLLALSLALFLAYQVRLSLHQRKALIQIERQQAQREVEAAQAEQRLKAMMLDVLKLSETDADAREFVRKYNIKFTPPPAQQPPPSLPPQIQ